MTLAAGSRLGPYEVLSTLGEGGMGEVYRARDAKLNRDVAIKVGTDRAPGDSDPACHWAPGRIGLAHVRDGDRGAGSSPTGR